MGVHWGSMALTARLWQQNILREKYKSINTPKITIIIIKLPAPRPKLSQCNWIKDVLTSVFEGDGVASLLLSELPIIQQFI